MNHKIETHPTAPFLPQNAKVLMLGSFPPPKVRWKMDFYYPNYNNDMWRIMGSVFYHNKHQFVDVEHKTFKQSEIEQFLHNKGIAISDTAYKIIRLQNNASDKFLQVVEWQNIAQLLEQIPQCQAIITTGEKATEELLQQYAPESEMLKVGQSVELNIVQRKIQLHRLPSSSRAYPLAIDKKAEEYAQVLKMYCNI